MSQKMPGLVTEDQTNSLISKLTRKVYRAQSLSVSLIIHVVLGITLGGVVLFKSVKQSEGFVVTDTLGIMAPSEEPASPDTSDPSQEAEFESGELAEEVPRPVNASSIQSLAENVSFQLSSSPLEQTTGSFVNSASLSSQLSASTGTGGSRSRLAPGSLFGSQSPSASGLVGTFYDLKQTNKRKPTEVGVKQYEEIVSEFVSSWNPGKLNGFFRAPHPLVSSQIFTPIIKADEAPKAFAVEKDVQPSRWLAWYRARVSPPESGTYHFVGGADDVLFVRFNGKLVLNGSWQIQSDKIKMDQFYGYNFSKIPKGFAKGPEFRAEKGRFYDLEILIGEQPGVFFFADLMIEQSGATYEKDPKGNPILPVFRVSEETPATKEGLYPPHLKDGPVWSVEPPRK